ncbi:MAG: Protein TolB [Cyanobacteria bacterium RYN_339]|nr:Protein TolB [Cyanobacteria bacterium RYN_339]
MPEIAAKLITNVVDNTVRKAGNTAGREVAEKAVKEAFGKDVKDIATKGIVKATEAPLVELPKIKLRNKVELLVGANANIDAPRLSPDKKSLTYVVRETKDISSWIKRLLGLPVDEPTERMTAWIAPVDGKAAPEKIAGRSFHNVVEPSFTPDGKSIIYCEQKNLPLLGGRGEKLKEMRLDQRDLATGKVTTIYDGELTLLHPMYSPDGKQIAAYARNIKGEEGLYLLDATKPGSKPVRLTMGDDKHPVWSNDGKKIYFHNQVGGDAAAGADGAEHAWVGMVDLADPKNPKRIMLDDVNSPFFHKHPTPLPDSDLVVYHSTADDKTKLEVLNTVTGQRGRLDLEGTSPNGSPLKKFKHAQFSSDGEDLVMVAKAGKKDELNRGIPEFNRVYVLQEANQIVAAFKSVFGG